jgi:hypothetical protein
MDESAALIAASCAVLAALVWLMWRAASAEEWGQLTQSEKRKWRVEEEKRKEGA